MFKLLVLSVAFAAVWGLPPRLFQKFGRTIPDGRIAGGYDADIADYPHILTVIWYDFVLCAGSIISPKWALTTSTCTQGVYTENLVVKAGTSNRTGGQNVPVKAIYKHPLYNSSSCWDVCDYDISLLELAEDITIETASPIALFDAGYVAEEGSEAAIAGFGSVGPIGFPDVLQAATVNIINHETCNETYNGLVTDRMFCAGDWENGGVGPCAMDFGGPLVIDGKLYGIIAWISSGCDEPHKPAGYTRPSEESLRAFVKNITGI